MVWQQIAFVVFAVIGVVCSIVLVGRPREPVTPGDVVCCFGLWLGLSLLVISI
ncbi:hypothetical protein [Bifidobacterium panos]|uniref:Uncharacterized protein n=1 Tax=Bifidobacterium panos TaxID=2675321 RepID=A0ABX1T080_9BIFI|nr:hypothetical protein [Bifidobacterium sp. DSM 109963]NMN02822.1 hypothetical protein [Bifidobacterium sp. DSM 109963]